LHFPDYNIYKKLTDLFVSLFSSEGFLLRCQEIQGEASCLIAIRRDQYVWWFSVGDCMLFLLHEDFKKFDQAMLNQTNFFEWIGRVNTFSLSVPCYSSGVRELRKGQNDILLITDGFLDLDHSPFKSAAEIYQLFYMKDKKEALYKVLSNLNRNQIKDSATAISWEYINHFTGRMPSN